MAISVTNLTILGTACPWKLGSGTPNTGPAATLEPYNTGFWDGSAANSGSAAQNSAYRYGRSHTNVAETAPTVLSGLTAGQIILLQYTGGTVATQGTGAGNSPPTGSATTGLTPLPSGCSDTETMPSDVVRGFLNGQNLNGVVNTSGTTVTWVSGSIFSGAITGAPIWINNVLFTVSSVTSSTVLVLTATAGTQTGVNFFCWGSRSSIGAIVGAFTDSSGNIVTGGTFDWASWPFAAGTINAFTLTSVTANTGTYTGTITGGGSNAFAGWYFTITGFTNSHNNGTFLCTASTTTSLTLTNLPSQAETHAATATQYIGIALQVPAGATKLSMGVNDSDLHDNTGSFSVTATILDSVGWTGDAGYFVRYPYSQCAIGSGADHSPLKTSVAMTVFVIQATVKSANLVPDYAGQLFPHGAQQSGGSPAGTAGQNFPY